MTRPSAPSFHKKGRRLTVSEDIVAAALTFLADDPEQLSRFFDFTGLGIETLRAAAARPEFAESLLDYIAGDERCLLAFAAEIGRDPAEIAMLRQHIAPPPAVD